MDKDVEDSIRTRAYLIWLDEGQPHGRDAEHWARAEADVAATGGAKPKRASTRRASPEKADADAEAKPAATQGPSKPRGTPSTPRRPPGPAPRPRTAPKRPQPEAHGDAPQKGRPNLIVSAPRPVALGRVPHLSLDGGWPSSPPSRQ